MDEVKLSEVKSSQVKRAQRPHVTQAKPGISRAAKLGKAQVSQPPADEGIGTIAPPSTPYPPSHTVRSTMNSLRVARAAIQARPAASALKMVQRRGYADVAPDKIRLSLALPHQVCLLGCLGRRKSMEEGCMRSGLA